MTISVAKLAIADMIPVTIAHASSLPCTVFFSWIIGPIPCAREIAHAKNAIPANGTNHALTVKRWRILCTGNQMAGSDPSQNRKKLVNAMTFVPDMLCFSRFLYEGQMARIIRLTHSPPIQP